MQHDSTQRQPKAAIYCRVSSDKQEIDGTSLDTQLAACRAYAAEHGYQVVSESSDTWTGAQYRERPKLKVLRDSLRSGGIDVVLCFAVDRLSRNQAHLYILAEEIDSAGARLELVTETFEDSAVGRFIMSAKAFAAEVEREKIGERSVRGRIERIRRGKLLPSVRPLYGYSWAVVDAGNGVIEIDKGRLQINPETAPIVERIFHDITGGATIRAIAHGLTTEGIPTPTGRSSEWSFSTIGNICRKHAYMGDAYGWGHHKAKPGESSQRFDMERAIPLPEGTIPPIVERSTWNAAQRVLDHNKQRASRNRRYPDSVAHLRGGLAVCGYCGMTLNVIRKTEGVYVYKCPKPVAKIEERHYHSIRTHALDSAAWEAVRRFMLQKHVIADAMERLRDDTGMADERRILDQALQRIDRQRANLTRAIGLTDDPETAAGMVAQLEGLQARRRELDKERGQVDAAYSNWERSYEQLRGLDEWRETAAENLDNLDVAARRQLFDVLGLRARLWASDHTPRFDVRLEIDPSVIVTDLDIVSTTC